MEVRSVAAIVRALNAAGVRYLIVGGVAVNAHGYERATQDVDLVIGLERDNIVRGLHALCDAGYNLSIPVTPEQFADPALRDSWRHDKGMIVLKLWSDLHRRTPVDVFVHEPFAFDAEYEHAQWEPIDDELNAPIVRYETLVQMKRAAGRPRDMADIADLEAIQKWKKEQ